MAPSDSTPSLGPAGRLRSLFPAAGPARAAFATLLLAALAVQALTAGGVRGLPFSRVYSLEDIGYVPRGSRLSFDPFGRLSVVHDGVYSVLNDTTWLNLAETATSGRVAVNSVAPGNDGMIYYGALGSWGRAEIHTDGKLHAVPLVPVSPPAWTQAATFHDVLPTSHGIYFASKTGVVFWDPQHERAELFELPTISRAFRVGERIYVSCLRHPLQYIDVRQGVMRTVQTSTLLAVAEHAVERATELDEQHALLALLDGRLVVFDGQHITPWAAQVQHDLTGRISALQRLADGNIAVAITEKGVFVLSPTGQLLTALTIPQYHRVSDIASREPGVMWLITEDAIEKVLYGSGLTWFGQRLGLALEWPTVASWQGRTVVASAGVLYEAPSSGAGLTARFESFTPLPLHGVWAVAAQGSHLLVGNDSGLFSVDEERHFHFVAAFKDLAHLIMVDEGRCLAIGPTEIAAFAWDGRQWSEPVPRLSGVPNASVVHRAGRSAWVEMGSEGVARVTLGADGLQLLLVPNETWTRSLWANVGVVNDVVVLAANRHERRFFDERTGAWCEQPQLNQLLDRSPEWLSRVRNDAQGNLWATHNGGVVRFTPRGGAYDMDALSYDLINDRYPIVQVLPGDEVWISASRSLYRVEPNPGVSLRPFSEPVLVSLTDARRGAELLTSRSSVSGPLSFSYATNDLTFRFFAGTYAWRRTPQYEYRLNPQDSWSTLDRGSQLRFPGLHEGSYRLEVRIAGQMGEPGPAFTLPFHIQPPWHRTWPAYTAYGCLLLLAALASIRWSGGLARKRNQVLEQVVHDRTRELESTMQKLNEEARITATLAERNRLAGEIHDSVQQGLSGAILQLDTTLTLPVVGENLRTRLNVVRNMVSYARQEVQHAVWDLDSPLLEGRDLGEALHKLTTLLTSGSLTPRLEVLGAPFDLPRAQTHHLLRIAQEATTNALRHARATVISIHLEYLSSAVALTITDDGRGFQPETVLNQAGHFGLRGVRNRARKLHGSLSITSTPGAGTTVSIHVPLHPPHSPSEAHRHGLHENSYPAG